jgi:serine protease Do
MMKRAQLSQMTRVGKSGLMIIGTALAIATSQELFAVVPNPMQIQAAQAELISLGETVYRGASSAVVSVQTQDGEGSGVILRRDGLVVTNAHVVGSEKTVAVLLPNGDRLKADVVAMGAQCNDMALLQIRDRANLPTLPLASSETVHPGQVVYAIGNGRGYAGSFKEGRVSRYGMGDRRIQTSLPLDPGDSGSPLLNDAGRMIGLNTSIRSDSRSLSFSIPVERVHAFLKQYDAKQTSTTPASVQVQQSTKPIALNGKPVEGQLTAKSNRICSDNSFFDQYQFTGQAGQSVQIRLESAAFLPYLVLLDPDGKEIAIDKNTPKDDYAIIMHQLPKTGTYRIIANSIQSEKQGTYTLSVSPMLLWRLGELSDGNRALKDGSWYTDYAIEGAAQQDVTITLYSSDFTPYLLLVNDKGDVVAESKDVKSSDKLALVKLRLPSAGRYRVVVSTLKPKTSGHFSVAVR